MTIIYALKDSLSGEYLTKADTLQRLSTTTRTFQKERQAQKVAHKSSTYFWMAVKQLCYGQKLSTSFKLDDKLKKVSTIIDLNLDKNIEDLSKTLK